MINTAIVETVVVEMHNSFKGSGGIFSETRDIFLARLQSFVLEKEKYLEAAIIGEIGNNTFDHNFGFFTNYPKGVYWDAAYKQKYMVLADYGKGIRQSLSIVLPAIASDMEAIEAAFTKRISGRHPEQRGNGLKFVSDTIQQNNWHLFFQSGLGSCTIDKDGILFYEKSDSLAGCLAIIDFSEE
jgi:hypothetical protein